MKVWSALTRQWRASNPWLPELMGRLTDVSGFTPAKSPGWPLPHLVVERRSSPSGCVRPVLGDSGHLRIVLKTVYRG